MYADEIEERVTRLEDLMAELIPIVKQTERQMQAADVRAKQFSHDVQAFIERSDRHMQAFTERSEHSMEAFKAEMRAADERSAREMREFKKEMRKEWGELSNKLGTMAEDLVAPSVARIFRTVMKCGETPIDFQAVRVKCIRPKNQEFDVVAVCGEYVFINETKSNLRPGDIKKFAALMRTARDYFPNYADKKFIGAIASLYVDDSLVRSGEKQGLIVLGFGEDVMDVLNSPEFVPRFF